MFKFDTLDKKPKVWNLAALSAAVFAALVFVLTRKPVSLMAVFVLITGYLACAVLILFFAFTAQIRYNPYSYNTIYYSGFAIFFLFALIAEVTIFTETRGFRVPPHTTVLSMLAGLLESARTFMLATAPFIFAYSAALCISNISLIRHEGRRPVNLMGILLSVLMVGGELFLFFGGRYASGSQMQVMFQDLVVNLFAALYLYFECMLIGTIIANVIVTRYEPDKDKDFIIILGCGMRKDGTPTPLLRGRVDRALRFYRQQIRETGKAPVLIPSGGQGPREVTTECESMAGYIRSQGVPEEHILREDRAGNTYENMLFSKNLINAKKPGAKTAFATTNYHVFRSGLLGRRVGLRAVGMGARTVWYFWPNAAVREFFGLLKDHRLKQGLILGGITLLYAVFTIVYYRLV